MDADLEIYAECWKLVLAWKREISTSSVALKAVKKLCDLGNDRDDALRITLLDICHHARSMADVEKALKRFPTRICLPLHVLQSPALVPPGITWDGLCELSKTGPRSRSKHITLEVGSWQETLKEVVSPAPPVPSLLGNLAGYEDLEQPNEEDGPAK